MEKGKNMPKNKPELYFEKGGKKGKDKKKKPPKGGK